MELQTVLNYIQSSLECAFCKSYLQTPVSARCEHSFCDHCATHAVKARLPCPLCKKYAKSRSLKKSVRLQSLIPLVHKLIGQSQSIVELLHEDKDQTGAKTVENGTVVNMDSTNNGKSHNKTTTSQTKKRRRKTTEKSASRLWGRLLSASPSTSSSEFEESENRGTILHREPSLQSVEDKVVNWLESSIPDPETGKCQFNDDDDDLPTLCERQSDFSEDLIATSLATYKGKKASTDNCNPNTSQLLPDSGHDIDGGNRDGIFSQIKPLKTFGSGKKMNTAHRRQSLELSEDSQGSSKTEVNEDSVKRSQSRGTVTIRRDGNNANITKKSSRSMPLDNETSLNNSNKNTIDSVDKPAKSNEQPMLRHPYNRLPIIDKFSVTTCGFVDIHNPEEDSNIVLRHLENALADLPRGNESLFSWRGIDKDAKSILKKGIVHSSPDLISAISDSCQSANVPEKRRAQTGMRTRPKKRSKQANTRSKHSNQNAEQNSQPHNLGPHQKGHKSFSGCVSENDVSLRERNQPFTNNSKRSSVSDGKLTSMRSTYIVSNLKGLPDAWTSAFVKVIRLDEEIAVSKTIKLEALSSVNDTSNQNHVLKPAEIKGRVVSIDLTKPQEWEQKLSDNEADDIICCSWNETEKLVNHNHSWHEECSDGEIQACAKGNCDTANSANDTISEKDCYNIVNVPSTESDVVPNKKIIEDIIHALDAVTSIDKEFLSKYFPLSSSLINQVIDASGTAITVFKKEIAQKGNNDTNFPSQNGPHEIGKLQQCQSSKQEEVDSRSLSAMSADKSLHERKSRDSFPEFSDTIQRSKSQLPVPDSLPDMASVTMIPSAVNCHDHVTAKVESWLSSLNNHQGLQEKQHKETPCDNWLESSSNRSRCSNRRYVPSELDSHNSETNKLSTNDPSVRCNADTRVSQKEGVSTNLNVHRRQVARRTKNRSRSSTPLTIKSQVDPSPVVEEDKELDLNHIREYFDESTGCDSELVAITTNISNDAKTTRQQSQECTEAENTRLSGKPAKSISSNTNGRRKFMGYRIPKKLQSGDVSKRGAMNHQANVNPLGFVTSGLQEPDVKLVKVFANRYNGTHLDTFLPGKVSHVIMKATPSRSCDRTLKYLLGIACKKWIVSTKWVTDSIRAGTKLDESEYEVLGDNCLKEIDSEPSELPRGPTRSRVSASDFNLFGSYLCLCVPPFSLITVEQTTQLLQYCGATVAKNFDELEASKKMKNHFRNRLVIVDTEFATDFPNYSSIEQEYYATVVCIEWVYESISRFQCQSLERYSLANITQDSNVN